MTTWEYKIVNDVERLATGRIDQSSLQAVLDQEGRAGWELATMFEAASEVLYNPVLLIFKRPLPSP